MEDMNNNFQSSEKAISLPIINKRKKKRFVFLLIILIFSLGFFIIKTSKIDTYMPGSCFFRPFGCSYKDFDIKDFDLSEYFNNPNIGIRKKKSEVDLQFAPLFPPITYRYYEWDITYNDYYGNKRISIITTKDSFYKQIHSISEKLLEEDINKIVSKEFLNIGYLKTNVYITKPNINPIFNNFYPKDINFYDFFRNNPEAVLQIQSRVSVNERDNISHYFSEQGVVKNLVFLY